MNRNQPTSGSVVLRASVKYWLNESAGPPLLLLSFAIVILALDWRNGLGVAALCAAASLLSVRSVIVTARTRLEVDDRGLRGRIHNQPFDLSWTDMRALRRVEVERKKSVLQIGSEAGGVQFMLDELDAAAVWQALQRCAPIGALAEDAFDSLPWVQEQRAAEAAWLAGGAARAARVKVSAWLAAFGWISLVFWAVVSYLAWRGNPSLIWLFFFVFTLPSLYLIYAGSAVTEIRPEMIRLTMPLWPTYVMRWDEVQRAAMDHGGNQIVLYGAGKRMTLPGPAYWRQADKEAGLAAFFGHLGQRRIPFEKTTKAYFALPKGARMRRGADQL